MTLTPNGLEVRAAVSWISVRSSSGPSEPVAITPNAPQFEVAETN